MNYQSATFRPGVTRICPTCGHEHLQFPVAIDPTANRAKHKDWTARLTRSEAIFLHSLAQAYPGGRTWDQLSHALYGGKIRDSELDPVDTIKTMCCKLRSRLLREKAPFVIITNWGVGYSLRMCDGA